MSGEQVFYCQYCGRHQLSMTIINGNCICHDCDMKGLADEKKEDKNEST